MKKNISFKTFGCRLNTYETEVMRKLSEGSNHENVTVINTCAVTNDAVKKAKKTIRKIKKTSPKEKILITGCAAQIEPETFLAMPEVSKVFGNTEKLQKSFWNNRTPNFNKLEISDIMAQKKVSTQSIDKLESRARAYVQIQNGCDHRCTFCIIPFGRGNSRSLQADLIVDQVKKLTDVGFKEIVLTGVDITSWGADLTGSPKLSFLLKEIIQSNKKLTRLRLSSIDQIELDDEFFNLFANEQKLMPHLHLSLQSGDNLILKRMKRRHSRESAIEFCEKVRDRRKDVRFGADLIAGFPTETNEMFKNTLKIIDECQLTWLHVFPFSPKNGTPAAKMPQVGGKIINERATLLREKGASREAIHHKSLLGKKKILLMEASGVGRTECFTKIKLGDEIPSGKLITALVSDECNKNTPNQTLTGVALSKTTR